mmetsp:Transcript_51556/g.130342  ORF Transcript_51556/g.130342 Transcript_51556/m.130342 type:complete len:210 (-) Transcript_51556:1274-1903(-)
MWRCVARHDGLVHPLPHRQLAPLVEEAVHPLGCRQQQRDASAVELVESHQRMVPWDECHCLELDHLGVLDTLILLHEPEPDGVLRHALHETCDRAPGGAVHEQRSSPNQDLVQLEWGVGHACVQPMRADVRHPPTRLVVDLLGEDEIVDGQRRRGPPLRAPPPDAHKGLPEGPHILRRAAVQQGDSEVPEQWKFSAPRLSHLPQHEAAS